jgi:hypothetical protein
MAQKQTQQKSNAQKRKKQATNIAKKSGGLLGGAVRGSLGRNARVKRILDDL